MSNRTILAKQEIDQIMQVAKQCAEQGGCVRQLVLLHVAGDQFLQMHLNLEGDADAKAVQLLTIGAGLYARGLTPSEALLVSESWIVNAQKAPAAMQFAPSQHPARQEAIVIVGRSADNRRYSQVIQPFMRDKANRPVWQPRFLATYDEPRTAQDGPTGVLDYLFAGIPAGA